MAERPTPCTPRTRDHRCAALGPPHCVVPERKGGWFLARYGITLAIVLYLDSVLHVEVLIGLKNIAPPNNSNMTVPFNNSFLSPAHDQERYFGSDTLVDIP